MPTAQQISRLHALIWILIFGGLLMAGLGLFIQRTDAAVGLALIVCGALETSAGFGLVLLRSRLADPPPEG